MLRITVWTALLANTVIAFAGITLSEIFDSINAVTIEGGFDSLPYLSKLYFGHEKWCFVAFSAPLLLAALFITLREQISVNGVLLFGGLTALNVALQIYLAVVAVGRAYIPISVHGHWLESARSP